MNTFPQVAEGSPVELRNPGSTLATAMDDFEKECLWELVTMPGWELIEKRMAGFSHEYATRVMTANRNAEAGDRYEVGRYDGVKELMTFLEKVIMDASPGD